MLLPVSRCVRGTVLVNSKCFVHSREDLYGVAHKKRFSIRTYPKSTVNKREVCVCVCTRTCLHVYGLVTLFTDLSSLRAVIEFYRIINVAERAR